MSFPYFISDLFVFILLNFKSSLYILHTSPLSNILFANIFPLCILFIWPVKRGTCRTNVFNFDKVQFLIFFFYGNFPVKSKITWPCLGPEDFLQCFLFYVLWFYLLHLWSCSQVKVFFCFSTPVPVVEKAILLYWIVFVVVV